MNEFEKQLIDISKGMDYPSTPDIAGFVSARLRPARSPRLISKTWAWSLTIILILLSSLMLIPSARAAILEFIQIGIVRIFPQPIEPTVEPIQTIVPSTATPISSLPFLETIAGKTTLEDAQGQVPYPILLPTYPVDSGEPDHIYIQNADGNMTILVWLNPQNPETVLMSLHFIPDGSWAITKVSPTLIEETTVDGVRAIWAVGPYPLRFTNGDLDFTRIVDGNVLIWADDTLTYRLETNMSLEEALKVAESLVP